MIKEVLIIGAGLSGLTAAYEIKSSPDVNVTILEKGAPYWERLSSENPDLLCGVGGAGTIGGGKLCFPPASSGIWKKTGFTSSNFDLFLDRNVIPFIKGELCRDNSMENAVNHFSILSSGTYEKKYDSILLYKHELNHFVKVLTEAVLKKGILLYTNCVFKGLEHSNDNSYTVSYLHEGELVQKKYDIIIFASGRSSARNLRSWLPKEVKITNTCPDLGFRISLNAFNNHAFCNTGKDIKIKATIGNIMVRTFCVCSGGDKILVSTDDFQYFDGHFGDKKTEVSNLGLLARSPKLVGYEFAAQYCNLLKRYLTSEMTLRDFVKYWNTLIPESTIFDEVLAALAHFVKVLQNNSLLPDNLDQCQVFLPSVDNLNASVETNQSFETSSQNLYVIGDACGVSRGFIQSMWSAHCACKDILSKLDHKNMSIQGFTAI